MLHLLSSVTKDDVRSRLSLEEIPGIIRIGGFLNPIPPKTPVPPRSRVPITNKHKRRKMLLSFVVLHATGRLVLDKRWRHAIPRRMLDELW